MKKLIVILSLFIGLLCIYTNGFADDLRKKVAGKWCNPYTYESTGKFKGFHLKKNGKCKAIGVADLKLESWEIKNGRLITRGTAFSEKEQKWKDYYTSERIELVNADSLYLIGAEQPYKIGFMYMSPKVLKKKVVPFSGQFDK